MCLTPVNLKKETIKQKLNDSYFAQQVPCGRCIECRKGRVNSWFSRLSSELSVSRSAYFVTFTYDENSLCYSDNGLLTLNYRDYQLFIKRLRKRNLSSRKIKYFCVGEYGSQTHRPHYHAIIFNVNDPSLFQQVWDKGHVHVGDVKEASIFYTLKYSLKSSVFGNTTGQDPDDDRIPEKALMSKGLGLSYLTDAMVQYHKDDVSRPITMLGNTKIPLSRYYRDKLFTDAEKSARRKMLEPFLDKRYDQISDKLFPQRVETMYNKSKEKLLKTD
jgi:hypothetical protein